MPWSEVAILGMVIPPFNRNPYNGYINPYYWVDDHPLLYGNNGSLDPGTYRIDIPGFLSSIKKLRGRAIGYLGFCRGPCFRGSCGSDFLDKCEIWVFPKIRVSPNHPF